MPAGRRRISLARAQRRLAHTSAVTSATEIRPAFSHHGLQEVLAPSTLVKETIMDSADLGHQPRHRARRLVALAVFAAGFSGVAMAAIPSSASAASVSSASG